MIALAFALALSGVARAEPATFHIDPAHTTAEFAVTYLGFAKQHGRFERTHGTVVLDPVRSAGSVDFVIDAVSVDTGWDLRDTYLRGEQMFDTARYPEVRFRSTRLVYDDALLVAIDGEITMHGVRRPIRLAVRHIDCQTDPAHGREDCAASVVGRLSRSAFGMDFAYPLIGDDVELVISVTANRARTEAIAETP